MINYEDYEFIWCNPNLQYCQTEKLYKRLKREMWKPVTQNMYDDIPLSIKNDEIYKSVPGYLACHFIIKERNKHLFVCIDGLTSSGFGLGAHSEESVLFYRNKCWTKWKLGLKYNHG